MATIKVKKNSSNNTRVCLVAEIVAYFPLAPNDSVQDEVKGQDKILIKLSFNCKFE